MRVGCSQWVVVSACGQWGRVCVGRRGRWVGHLLPGCLLDLQGAAHDGVDGGVGDQDVNGTIGVQCLRKDSPQRVIGPPQTSGTTP